ncbi:hypothetical protein DEU56DRAFT_828980 [Suillus clintonianus]|uniref:uncharacterized protein n=1 Tax=Suillus clintonianus TaxID=1904413 RepID=UPI001B85F4F7|nr:uncharacterized protein DEU56DRAFT_828980 [Suillus clintonianus]KAG2123833.1 hypothetical protein DEU56DRAFT_828980 [Suillus clintonianus]
MSYVQPNQTLLNPAGPGSNAHYVQATHPPHPPLFDFQIPNSLTLADGRKAKRVPRPQGITPFSADRDVQFRTNNWPGVRVKDILKNNLIVDKSLDLVFANTGWRQTCLALEWPGYMPSSYYSRYFDVSTEGRLMNRQEFAQTIACHIVDLYNDAKGKPIAHGCEEWAFNQNNVRPSDVIILSAHHYPATSGRKGKWVPELYVIV